MTTSTPLPPVEPPTEPTPGAGEPGPRPLLRSRDNRIAGGVCGGIAAYAGVDPTLVRFVTVLLAIVTGGSALLAYLVAWAVIPEAGQPPLITDWLRRSDR